MTFKSGIVFYPDYGVPNPGAEASELAPMARDLGMHLDMPSVKRPAGPNLARQLGAVTNAEMDAEGVVTLGTAHAVPYEPAIGVELTKMYYPSGRYGVDGFLVPQNKAVQARHEELKQALAELAYGYLDAQGLAANGLVQTLSRRRIDLIAPRRVPDRGFALAATMTGGRPKLPGEPTENAFGTVWVENPETRGEYFEQFDAFRKPHLLNGHPLRVMHGNRITAQSHTIATTRATGQAQLHEGLIIATDTHGSNELKRSRGFSYDEIGRTVSVRHKAAYDLPVPAETAAEIERLQWVIAMENEAAAMERAAKQPEDLDYDDWYHPNAAGDAIRKTDLHQIVFHLDPLDDPDWRDRLS